MTKEEKRVYNKVWRERHPDYYNQRYKENREEIKTKNLQYQKEHASETKERKKKYLKTIEGKASKLHNNYRCYDIARGFDVSDVVTSDWIMEHVLTKTCVYCGESDWEKLGADRIDNTKPHTPENCVCACEKCNKKRQDKYTVEEFKEYVANGFRT